MAIPLWGPMHHVLGFPSQTLLIHITSGHAHSPQRPAWSGQGVRLSEFSLDSGCLLPFCALVVSPSCILLLERWLPLPQHHSLLSPLRLSCASGLWLGDSACPGQRATASPKRGSNPCHHKRELNQAYTPHLVLAASSIPSRFSQVVLPFRSSCSSKPHSGSALP